MKPFKVNEFVIIKKYKDDEMNRIGQVVHIYPDGRIWVENMNMPFMGTVSDTFKPEELEHRKD